MKKTITTLALALSLCCVAQAQNGAMGQSASKPAPGAKLLSTCVDGNYKVCKWLVPEMSSDNSSDFSVKYQINLARLISSYDDNARELQGLRAFVDGVANDKSKDIKRIVVTGYASPDGPTALNTKLAKERAVDCSDYLKEHHDIESCPCSSNGVALKWSDAVGAITNSTIPSKSDVLQVIEGGGTQMAIEQKLRAMDSSWEYMAKNILPPMRRVEIEVVYSSWIEMETRTQMVPEVEEVVVENNYIIFMEENPSDVIIFENENAPLDYDNCKDKLRFKDNHHRDKFKVEDRGAYGRDKAKGKYRKGRGRRSWKR